MAKQEPHLVLCKDEMTESADAEEIQSRLWSMFNVRFQSKLQRELRRLVDVKCGAAIPAEAAQVPEPVAAAPA